MGEFDRALTELSEAIRSFPNNAFLYKNRALSYEGKRDYDRAIADMQRALAIDPKNEEALDGLARIEQRKVAQDAMASGTMYVTGQGVERNLLQAYRWFSTAASFLPRGPDQDAALAARDQVARQLTPADLASVQNPQQRR